MLHSLVLNCLIGILTLQSMYTVLDHQLQDGLVGEHEFHCTQYIVWKLWDLKLQIHMIQKESMQLSDVIGYIITLVLFVYMSRLIAKGIIRSYSMWQRGRIAVKPIVNMHSVTCT